MSSQAIYPRLLPWHYNDRQYQLKQYRALLELHITQGQLEFPGRQHTAQLTFYME